MAQRVITDGFTGKDAIDQARQKPKSVAVKVRAVTDRINTLTDHGRFSVDQVIQSSNNLADNHPDKGKDAAEVIKLVGTMNNMTQGMGANYASAAVSEKTTEALEELRKNPGVVTYMDRLNSQRSGRPGVNPEDVINQP
jgi:hypothetical protein